MSQDSRIVNSELFNGFLLNAQQETKGAKCEDVSLSVYFPNAADAFQITVKSTDRSSLVLDAAIHGLKLPLEYASYFTLYVGQFKKEHSNNGDDQNHSSSSTGSNSKEKFLLIRRLQNFEAPYLTLATMNNNSRNHFIVIRKAFWDSTWDDDLLTNDVATEMLYLQTVSDVERGWIHASKESRRLLRSYQDQNDKREVWQ